MKILFISDYFQPYAVGAANISTYVLAKKLAENNECFVMTQKFQEDSWKYGGLDVFPQLPKYYPDKGQKDILRVELISLLSLRHFLTFYRKIKGFLKLKNIDIVNIQSNKLMLIVALLILDKPVVIDVRDYYFTCPFMEKTEKCDRFHLFCLPSYRTKKSFWLANALGTFFFRYQSFVYFIEKNLILKTVLFFKWKKCVFVANSQYVKETLVKEFKNKNIQIEVIYNSINSDDYAGTLPKKMRKILYASSLEKSKGIWDCILAFEKLPSESDVVLEIAGDGPEFDSVEQYLKLKKITNIRLLGRLDYKEIPRLYQEAYLTIQPSVWPEPFGRFILESFASGTPLITTATGGTTEAIRNHENGLLVPPGNPEILSEAISELLGNHELYNRICVNMKKEAEKYQPEAIVQKRLSLYKRLIETNL